MTTAAATSSPLALNQKLPQTQAEWQQIVNQLQQTLNPLLQNNRTPAEIAAGVVPTNYAYPQGWVRRYGALGDGVTDDTAALNTAASIGIPLYFDKGNFLVKTAGGVTFNSSVSGASMGHSIITSQIDGSNHVLPITFAGSNIEISGLTIKGSSFLSNNSGSALVNFGGTSGNHATNVIMRDCEITQATSFAVYCTYTDGFLFTGNHVHDTGADGIHVVTSTDVRILANRFNACVDDLIAFTSFNTLANQNQNVVIDGNFCGMTSSGISRCILLESMVDCRVINNICYRTAGSTATNGMIELVRLATGNPNANVTIQGNTCINASSTAAPGIFIYGGTAVASGGLPGSQVRVLDNYVSNSNAGDAIDANAFAINTTVTAGNAAISATNSYAAGLQVVFTGSFGSVTGLTAGTTYYVSATGLSGSQFEVSATAGGPVITPGGSGTATPTVSFTLIDNLEISGNTCISTGGAGISMPSTTVATTLKVTRNRVFSFTNGILLTTNALYNIVSHNDILYNGQNSGSNSGIQCNPSVGGQLIGNVIAQQSGFTSGFNLSIGSTILVRENVGWVTENSGQTGAISTGATVSHGLQSTPNVVDITQIGATPVSYSVSALGSTTFTINFSGGGTQTFSWIAKLTNAF